MDKKFYLPEYGYEVTIGKFASQADGMAWFKQGGTILLSTVVAQSSKEFPGFLPLTTDYREQSSAAGKIPGGYFKREGKSSDKEILTSRLIDRAIRPLFPANYFNQIQVLSTVYSVDREHTPYVLSLIASSIALTVSNIPFLGPIGAVEIARVNGEWIVNPIYSKTLESDVKIVVAGTEEGICMVEGRTNQISEKEFVDALFLAHDHIKKQVAWQLEIQKEVGKPKDDIVDQFNWTEWIERTSNFITEEKLAAIQVPNKTERGQAMSDLKKSFFEEYENQAKELNISNTFLEYVFDDVLKNKLTDRIFETSKRVDGRSFDQVRNISTEVGLLPFTHGSALFNRGATQALVSVTLGGGQDEQKVEDIMLQDAVERSFMLHYNFPPFSVGEVRSLRGPGRREIGHGYLAASAIKGILPESEKFPYTIRIVADILESDGSSSMATVCGSTMALMNAGVPISDMVSGIAMGLLMSQDGRFQVISDIAGIEDAFGLMDFKVAGTEKGITAIQIDIKYKGGLVRDVFENAFKQAKDGRLHILNEMRKVMTAPNPNLSDLVPKIVSFKIPVDKIGAIIGTGGKTIREITEKTGTKIEIEEDGLVRVFGQPGPGLEQAEKWVKTLGGLIIKGSQFSGRIRKVAEFGIFVELVPGQDGLVHVSNLPKNMQTNFHKVFKLDDVVKVEVVDYDESTGRIRLKLIE